MAKRVGFDDEDGEEIGVLARLYHYLVWSLKSLILRAFDFSGRTGLLVFWIQLTFIMVVIALIFSWKLNPGEEPFDDPIAGFVYVAGLYLTWTLIVRRGHDIGISAWTYLNIFSLFRTISSWVELLFKPGDPAPNDYGVRAFMPDIQEKIDPKRIG